MKTIIAILIMFPSFCFAGEVYTWTDKNGVLNFSDRDPRLMKKETKDLKSFQQTDSPARQECPKQKWVRDKTVQGRSSSGDISNVYSVDPLWTDACEEEYRQKAQEEGDRRQRENRLLGITKY